MTELCCDFCGKNPPYFIRQLCQYDNGETFMGKFCPNCAKANNLKDVRLKTQALS